MSLPNERAIALANCIDFLRRLISPYSDRAFKRVPKEVRREARYALKHLPSLHEIRADLKKNPKYICKVELEKQIKKDFERNLRLFKRAVKATYDKTKKA